MSAADVSRRTFEILGESRSYVPAFGAMIGALMAMAARARKAKKMF